MIDVNKKIFVAGHSGMVGSAIVRKLRNNNYENLVLNTVEQLDLMNQQHTDNFFKTEKPEIVIVAAAKVGGILANNTFRAEFIYNNLMIAANVINASHQYGVEKLIFLGSSCIYPKLAPQPIKEEYLLTDTLEFTNEPYAIAKIAGIKLCESYFRQYNSNFYSVMPTNLYGPNDNFDLQKSHVLPALMRKMHDAKLNSQKTVELWGTGKPKREFLFVDDLADAVFFLMNNINATDLYSNHLTHLNIGTGEDLTISELAAIIKNIVNYQGEIIYDTSKPDGTPRKLLDVARINSLGWKHKTVLEEGIRKTYDWFLQQQEGKK